MNVRQAYRRSLLVHLISTLLFFSFSSPAQIGGGGSIEGVISDPSGAVVPEARVVATNVATSVETVRQSSHAGRYVITPLAVGEYRVTVSASGFRTAIQEKVMVDALTTMTVNITLQIGSAADYPVHRNFADAVIAGIGDVEISRMVHGYTRRPTQPCMDGRIVIARVASSAVPGDGTDDSLWRDLPNPMPGIFSNE